MAQDYNKTLNLPQTEFPMRAGLPQREPEFLKRWSAENIYKRLMEKNAGKPKHVLHDGPPFSNGSIHMGTAMNKVLKDFINRYKVMTGYLTPYVPGWDNHGMPIESAIIKQNKLDRKRMSIPEFRDACHAFAQKFVDIQMGQFIRLGVLADWEHPYLTMDPAFEAEEVRIFGEMYKKGYIYKGLKPVYWCAHDETALAEAEIEYKDEPCESIFVKFAVKDDKGKLAAFGDVSKMYVLIWTTTPWTLPGNQAIALNAAEDYVLAKLPSGEILIMAEALTEAVMKAGGVESWEIVGSLKGSEFEYMTAAHPFLDRESLLVNADYVTMDSGSGCVHTAPGFGVEDYMTGRNYNIEMIVPVDDKGIQTELAGPFAGMKYDESNTAIIEHLQKTGSLFAKETLMHSYPHCWRCKNPIIFRATPQWFCSVESFKDESVAACEKVRWLPEWGKERISSMIKERADWCISRQRHWGLPIPVFYCEDCKKPVCTEETVEATAALFGREGSNAWYIREAADILPQGFRCPHCGGTHFFKEQDTLDGWFDSGATSIASQEKGNPDEWPVDIYLEGADQYRGWFQSSLLVAVGSKGISTAPYKTVITHGWVVDGEGKAMHKSLGNSVAPEEIIEKYGADVLRLWVASSDYRVDVRVSDAIFKQLSQTYLKIRNTCRYILGNISDFDPNELVSPADMLPLDKWAVTRLNALIEKVTEGYESFEYHVVSHAVNNFCVVDMSNFYLDIIKDRLYCDGRDSVSRRSAQSAMFIILDSLVRMLAPILPFTADEVWQAMPHRSGDEQANIVFNDIHKPFVEYALGAAEMEEWNRLITLREEINASLEAARAAKLIGKPLEAKVKLSCEADKLDWLNTWADMLKTVLIVSGVEISEGSAGTACERSAGVFVTVEKADGEKCERCWTFDKTVGSNAEHPTLCSRCAKVVNNI